MNEDNRRSQIKKYFASFPKWAVVLIIVGVLLLAAKGLGVIPIAFGIWGIVSWSQRPSDQQMDAWIAEDLKKLHARALQKTGFDQAELIGEPVAVYGPRFWNIEGAGVGIKKGKDGVVRF